MKSGRELPIGGFSEQFFPPPVSVYQDDSSDDLSDILDTELYPASETDDNMEEEDDEEDDEEMEDEEMGEGESGGEDSEVELVEDGSGGGGDDSD